MKHVLVLYYTQSGQLTDILTRLLLPLSDAPDVQVHFRRVRPLADFPFPWTRRTFFDAFPESVLEVPVPMAPLDLPAGQEFDLVVLGYQPWFLSPSIPVSSLLGMPETAHMLAGKPVVTVIGCRNMWIAAQERIKARLGAMNARLVGNIVLRDRAPNLISVITILHWAFSGRKERWLKLFPLPGVAATEIAGCGRFGAILLAGLRDPAVLSQRGCLQQMLVDAGAVEVSDGLMNLELRARKIFGIWADFIGTASTARRARAWRLRMFSLYLIVGIFIASPIVSLLSALARLVNGRAARRKRDQFLGVHGQPRPVDMMVAGKSGSSGHGGVN